MKIASDTDDPKNVMHLIVTFTSLADGTGRKSRAHEHESMRRRSYVSANLRKTWVSTQAICGKFAKKHCVVTGLAALTEVDGKADPRYTGLIIHDFRRSAIKKKL